MSIAQVPSGTSLLDPPGFDGNDEGAVKAAASSSAVRRLRSAGLILLAGAVVTALLIAIMLVDPRRAWLWEPIHGVLAPAAGALAVAVSLKGTHGLVRQVRIGALLGLMLWLASAIAWVVLTLQGPPTFPTIADALAILWIVPGAWMIVITMRGRLGRAGLGAIYLDDAIVLLATVAVLLATYGPTAYFIGGPTGILVAIYPAIFIGAAAMSVVSVVATRHPLRLDGALAFALGTGLIGIAYCSWIIPAVTGRPIDHGWATLFSIGPLVVSYGAITYHGPTTLQRPQERLAATLSWTIGPVGVLMTAIAGAASSAFEPLNQILFGLTVLAAALLIVRFALHLHERTTMLAQVQGLAAENERLLDRLRLEAQGRERTQARLSDAARMTAVGELAAAVAHEVNNPLTGVLGYSDLLLADPSLRPDMRQDLQIVREEALRVRDRVRMLLDFATPRRPDDVAADLGAVVASPMALLRYHLERAGLVVEERYAPMAPILLDPAALQQVLINLVTEVSSAMPSGGRLAISTETANGGASIILDATGHGLDVDAIAAMDSPFDDDPDRDGPLGAIAASIGVLRGHDATIGVRAATAEHIRIEIHLPRRSSTPD